MTWYFRRGTVLPWQSRIQWQSHSLAGESSYCEIILECNLGKVSIWCVTCYIFKHVCVASFRHEDIIRIKKDL